MFAPSVTPPAAEIAATTTTPTALLVAWRAAERRYALALAGSDAAAAQHGEMRRLMDEYEWTVRGSIARRLEGPDRRG